MGPDQSTSSDSSQYDETVHQRVSSFFLGPRAENMDFFAQNIMSILENHAKARKAYIPHDPEFIISSIKNSEAFKDNTARIERAVKKASDLLGQHSGPYWSTRYVGHMCTDLSMPALLGYFMTMLYNPNNVVSEVSPLTTIAETRAGEQICDLFGFRKDPPGRPGQPGLRPWGHITCDGTVANLESICGKMTFDADLHHRAARNLKFYPLSLHKAIKAKALPNSLMTDFKVKPCHQKDKKAFGDLTTWEMLNLEVSTVLEIPDRLYNEFGISATALAAALNDYSIQTVGKDALEREYYVKPMKYLVANTKHYSWPKGLAVSGIGSGNLIGIDVDEDACIKVSHLRTLLQGCLDNQEAVYAVVAVMGTTEEGAVDPLDEIIQCRTEFQKQGLSFVMHCDAAWGSYFATMMTTHKRPGFGPIHGWIPEIPMRDRTARKFEMMKEADSITVDPHKAGYAPYPAGGLCYRDGRMRYLITWTTPYITRDSSIESIGIYGVEGSKPGAAAMSTWFTHQCIGLNPDGYGALLGEVSFTCARAVEQFAAQWAAMSTEQDPYKVVPLNQLPSERAGSSPTKVEEERQFIRDNILPKSNEWLRDPEHENAWDLLKKLGPDLNINAFACNFKLTDAKDGPWNTDVAEANYFNRRIVADLSIRSPSVDISKLPLILVSTEFGKKEYGQCANKFGERLGLENYDSDPTALFVLRSVIMSPFSTDGNFIETLVGEFKKVAEKNAEICRNRLRTGKDKHSFIVMGGSRDGPTYLVLRPNFHAATKRHQAILEVQLSETVNPTPEDLPILETQEEIDVSTIAAKDTFKASFRNAAGSPQIEVTVNQVLIRKDIHYSTSKEYPAGYTPFYLFGKQGNYYVDHQIDRFPNVQLSAYVSISDEDVRNVLDQGSVFLVNVTKAVDGQNVTPVSEDIMQPLPTKPDDYPEDFFFASQKTLNGTLWEASNGNQTLDVVLECVYKDSDAINRDPHEPEDAELKWIKEFEKIGEAM
ncbi:pyridoxal phosphate-dependent decarboxylase family protein [Aspergillus lucknowensis]|uniref:Pyridoxal phosphate-dependent transferase n=1 Tax=Aspergillus lucknowensis TaxID=176173 RepID=A0ABR4LJV8_9EURO